MTKKWLYNNSLPYTFLESILDNKKKAFDFLSFNLDYKIYSCFTDTALCKDSPN